MDGYASDRTPTYPEMPCVKLEDLTTQRRSRWRKMALTLMLGLLVGLTGRLETWASPTGIDFRAKKIGLMDTAGHVHGLAGSLSKGTLVVLFYRGQWNTHCRQTLTEVKGIHDRLQSLGANVVAISADEAPMSYQLSQSLKLPFPLLSDPDLDVSKQWGVAMHGDNVAKPAAYVLSRTGHVAFRHVSEHLGDTVKVSEILKAVVSLSKQ